MSLQGVICVVGGVRSDEHIRQLLQPQQQLVLDGPLAVVGVEDSFLTFEDIQRRAAEPAAFQRRGEEPRYREVNRVPY